MPYKYIYYQLMIILYDFITVFSSVNKIELIIMNMCIVDREAFLLKTYPSVLVK